jgi:Protein of unknown function (DUF3298)
MRLPGSPLLAALASSFLFVAFLLLFIVPASAGCKGDKSGGAPRAPVVAAPPASAAASASDAHAGALSADGKALDSTVTDPRSRMSIAIEASAARFDSSDGKFAREFKGRLGERPIRMRLRRDGARLEGVYRYGMSAGEIALTGSVAQDGSFDLTESVGGKVTGRFAGALVSTHGAVATWWSPDGSRSFPVVMEETLGEYPETLNLGAGLTMYPQERQSSTNGCDVDVLYPQVRGAKDKAGEAALNALLRGDREKPQPCEKPCKGPSCGEPQTSTPFYDEAYAVLTKTRGRFVGLEQSGSEHSAQFLHGGSWKTCMVFDTQTLAEVHLGETLTSDGRAKLSDKLTGKLQGDGPKLTERGYLADHIEVHPDTSFCLTDEEIVVVFRLNEIAPYSEGQPEVSFPKGEVRSFFEKSELMDALFGQ